jgi:hypothetical protein
LDGPLLVVGEHDQGTIDQMRNCMKIGNVVGGVITADVGPRQLVIRTHRNKPNQVLVALKDCGIGISAESATGCSMRSSPPNPAEWAWDFRSAVRSSKLTVGECGLSRTCLTGKLSPYPAIASRACAVTMRPAPPRDLPSGEQPIVFVGGARRFKLLLEDGERVLCRGWRDDGDGDRTAVQAVLSASRHPAPAFVDQLAHEYGLKDELDGRSAAH